MANPPSQPRSSPLEGQRRRLHERPSTRGNILTGTRAARPQPALADSNQRLHLSIGVEHHDVGDSRQRQALDDAASLPVKDDERPAVGGAEQAPTVEPKAVRALRGISRSHRQAWNPSGNRSREFLRPTGASHDRTLGEASSNEYPTPAVDQRPPAHAAGGRPGNVMETTGCNQTKNARLSNLPKPP
jgi:hypothetical protein